MKRTTVFVDEELEADLRALARRRRVTVAALTRQALRQYLAGAARRRRLPSFVAIGRSGYAETATRHEELLWSEGAPGNSEPAPSKKLTRAAVPDRRSAVAHPARRRANSRRR